jgi:Eukaryotic cytochrome b561
MRLRNSSWSKLLTLSLLYTVCVCNNTALCLLLLQAWQYWLKAHMAAQLTGLLLIIIGFALAVNLQSTEGYHFKDTHGRLGLALFIAALLQVLLAAVRPHPHTKSNSALAPTADSSAEQQICSSHVRTVWELQHRLFAALIICLAYYTISLGLKERTARLHVTWQQRTLVGVAVATAVLWVLLEVARHFKPAAFAKAEQAAKHRRGSSRSSVTAVDAAESKRQQPRQQQQQQQRSTHSAMHAQPLEFA